MCICAVLSKARWRVEVAGGLTGTSPSQRRRITRGQTCVCGESGGNLTVPAFQAYITRFLLTSARSKV